LKRAMPQWLRVGQECREYTTTLSREQCVTTSSTFESLPLKSVICRRLRDNPM
jgi:hypothetical protein